MAMGVFSGSDWGEEECSRTYTENDMLDLKLRHKREVNSLKEQVKYLNKVIEGLQTKLATSR